MHPGLLKELAEAPSKPLLLSSSTSGTLGVALQARQRWMLHHYFQRVNETTLETRAWLAGC